MNYQEAIKAIKSNYPPSNYSMLREALDLSIELLEKATPKKPNWIYDDEPLCPYCGEVLDGTEEHCDECDQRLDWGDTYVD